jgi:8-oxo-dGTP pyrophosphatase MutT (NUDIX family)
MPGSRIRRAAGKQGTGPSRPTAPRTLFEVSAGGVIYRRTRRGIAVCLIATKGGTRWQLPKGKREPGESLEATAAREVAEETGLSGTVGPRLDKIDLWFTGRENGRPVRHHKLVYFYLLQYRRGSTRDHDREVDDARWFDAGEALERLSFPSERRVVARALELIQDAAPITARPPM